MGLDDIHANLEHALEMEPELLTKKLIQLLQGLQRTAKQIRVKYIKQKLE